MPRFIDSHSMPGPVIPVQVAQGQVMQAVKAEIQAGQPDKFGVKGLNVFIAKDRMYCVTDAPSADAIHKSHEAKGIRLGPADVTEIVPLLDGTALA